MPSRPGPRLTRVLRMPVTLYDAGYGWVLGYRFLALTHRGRSSGRLFTVVLEVVDWRPEAREAVVMSGFGRASQWYRNVLAGGAVDVRIGRLRFPPKIRELQRHEAVAVLAEYEQRNRLVVPVVRAVLSRLAGFSYDGSAHARAKLVEVLPLVALSPAARPAPELPGGRRLRRRRRRLGSTRSKSATDGAQRR